MKTVRFHPDLETIQYTYSADDYDRSLFADLPHTVPGNITSFSSPTSSLPLSLPPLSPPPSPPSSCCRPFIAPLDLSGISKTPTQDHTRVTAMLTKEKKRQPKLMINTEITSGPLFFTHLSTQYRCRSEEDHDDDISPVDMMASRFSNSCSSLQSY